MYLLLFAHRGALSKGSKKQKLQIHLGEFAIFGIFNNLF